MTAKRNILDVDRESILEALLENGGIRATWRSLGGEGGPYTYHNVRDVVNEAKASAEGGVMEDLKSASLEVRLRALKLKYRTLLAESEAQREQVDYARQLIDDGPGPIVPVGVKDGPDGRATAVLVLSDWHAEERVDPESCNGLNAYNEDIFAQRVEKTFKKGLRFLHVARQLSNIDSLVVLVLGDLISGYIHEESQAINSCGPLEAVMLARSRLMGGIDYLDEHADVDSLQVGCCFGNHGRITHRIRASDGYANSLEWGMYHDLARRYAEKESRVKWHVARGYHLFMDIQGQIVRCHHGDGIRYYGGVGGLDIPMNKAVAQWNIGRKADYDIFGHWHQFKRNWRWVACGCLVGYNAYAVRIKAEYQPPTQTFLVFDQQRGLVMVEPLFVDE